MKQGRATSPKYFKEGTSEPLELEKVMVTMPQNTLNIFTMKVSPLFKLVPSMPVNKKNHIYQPPNETSAKEPTAYRHDLKTCTVDKKRINEKGWGTQILCIQVECMMFNVLRHYLFSFQNSTFPCPNSDQKVASFRVLGREQWSFLGYLLGCWTFGGSSFSLMVLFWV